MSFWLDFLPIIIYLLLIILIIVGIILGIRIIFTLNKLDKLADDINDKVQTLNGFFHIMDYATDKISVVTDKIADGVVSLFSKLLLKKKKNKKKKDDENE